MFLPVPKTVASAAGIWPLARRLLLKATIAGYLPWRLTLMDETMVSGGGDGQLIWWPAAAEKPAPIRRVQAHRGWVRALAFSPDGSMVASCGNDRMVRLWSFADGSPILELPGHELPVYRVLFNPNGRTLISADLSGRVIEWDFRPGKEARRIDAGKLSKNNAAGQGVVYGGVRDLALSADGKFLACGGLIEASNPLGAISNPAVIVFDWQTGKETKLLRPKENVLGLISGLRFHPVRVPDRGLRRQCGRPSLVLEARSSQRTVPLETAQHRPRHGPAPRRPADRDGPS